jgi:hypothetical protein
MLVDIGFKSGSCRNVIANKDLFQTLMDFRKGIQIV